MWYLSMLCALLAGTCSLAFAYIEQERGKKHGRMLNWLKEAIL